MRLVLAHLELVAHHGHFAVEILLLDEGIDHAVGFEIERPAQVFLGGIEGFVVVGAVPGSGAVGPRAVRREFARECPGGAACP